MTDQMQKNDQVQKTDKELLARFIQSSDETAVDELVKRYTPMVFRTGYRVLLDVHEANDVAQATFIVLIKKADSLKSVSNLGTWLHTVARNAAVNAFHQPRWFRFSIMKRKSKSHHQFFLLSNPPSYRPRQVPWRPAEQTQIF